MINKKNCPVLALFLLVLFSLFLWGCSNSASQNFIPNNWKEWKTLAPPVNYSIPGHGTNQRRMYMNPQGVAAVRSAAVSGGDVLFPDGTVIVKEVYESPDPSPEARPTMLTVMVKKSDDPRAKGGWLWIMRPYGETTESILGSEFCITCHANANESHPYADKNPKNAFRDYVFYASGALD